MPVIRNIEWLDHNGERAYPFAAEASRRDQTGSFQLPNDFITSLQLAVPVGLNVSPAKFFVSSVTNLPGGFAIVISYNGTGGDVVVASASVARAAHTPGNSYRLTGQGDFLDATGHLTLGDTGNIDNQPPGTFHFDFADGRLEPDAIRPMLRGLQGIRVQNNGELSRLLTGIVTLVPGRNSRISVVEVSGQDPQIVFDAIEGEGLNSSCECGDGVELLPPIRSINGVRPDATGNIELLTNVCLSLEQNGDNVLTLTETCGRTDPCCGCPELERITEQLTMFRRQMETLTGILNPLAAHSAQLDQNLLASMLGDRGCATCE